MKKYFILLLLVLACCGQPKTNNDKRKYTLFEGGNIPPTSNQIEPDKTMKETQQIEGETEMQLPELDFLVENKTGKTIFVCCFSYIQKEPFSQWRWDKSPIYKIDAKQKVTINIDTIPDEENLQQTFGYLAVFSDEKIAKESIYELVDDSKKIDLDILYKLKGRTIVVGVERYGFKDEVLDFEIKKKIAEAEQIPELDFVVENNTGKTIFVTAFIYQVKDDIRSVWTYDKAPILKLKQGQIGVINVDTVTKERDRRFMSGFLAIFEERQEKIARESTYELLSAKDKLSLGRLSRLKNKKVVIQVEQYGAIGEISEFDIQPATSPLKQIVTTKVEQTKREQTYIKQETPTKPIKNKKNYQLFA
jgi:hypothetical protein